MLPLKIGSSLHYQFGTKSSSELGNHVKTCIVDEHPECHELLETYFLHSSQEFSFNDHTDDLKKAEFLTAEGALIRCENTEDKTTFKISSPLIHNLLLWALRGKIKRKSPPAVPPLKSDGSLDIILLFSSIHYCL